MNKSLYFLPPLARATTQADTFSRFKIAFIEIQQLGQRPEYQRGFAQFKRFMAVAAAYADAQAARFGDKWPIHNLLAELMMDEITGSSEDRRCALELIHSEPRWAAAFAECEVWLSGHEQGSRPLECTLFESGRCLGTINFMSEVKFGVLSGLMPGSYRLCLPTGWVIWEQYLSERDLLLSRALPGEPLALAAATEEISRPMTREEVLLDGDLVLRVYPGLESGTVRIALRNSRVL